MSESFTFTLNGVPVETITSAKWTYQRPALPAVQRVTAYTAEGTITFNRGEWETFLDAMLRAHSRYWARRREFKHRQIRKRVAHDMGMTWKQWKAWCRSWRT